VRYLLNVCKIQNCGFLNFSSRFIPKDLADKVGGEYIEVDDCNYSDKADLCFVCKKNLTGNFSAQFSSRFIPTIKVN
jgi:hypothetical protein